jgi:drug/metabolite transporter (DMT)-like permease
VPARAKPSLASSRLLLLAASLCFSTGGAAIKATALTAWQVAGFRSIVAALSVFLLLPAARQGWSWRVAPVGAAYAGTMLLFVLSNKLTTAANSIFLQSTAPLYLLLLAPWLLQEHLRRRDLALIVAVAGGMALFFLGSERVVATAPNPSVGNVIAAVSGIFWALTIAGIRWIARRTPTSDATLAPIVTGNLIACAVALPLAFPATHAAAKDWLVIVYLGVVQIGIAYACLTAGLRRVPAFEASTIMLVEPVLNPLWAWMVHNERPSALALTGGAVIMTATLVNTWWHSRSAST